MNLTDKEKHTISVVASDLVSGRHLVTNITDDERNMIRDISDLFKSVMLNLKLTDREVEIVTELSNQFYGGMEDMCDQIGFNYKKLKHALYESDR